MGFTEAPSVSGRATVCVGFDDRVFHGIEVGAVIGIPPANQTQLGGASSIALDLDAEISDVGEPQEISIPSGGGFRPIRNLVLTLQDLGVSIP